MKWKKHKSVTVFLWKCFSLLWPDIYKTKVTVPYHISKPVTKLLFSLRYSLLSRKNPTKGHTKIAVFFVSRQSRVLEFSLKIFLPLKRSHARVTLFLQIFLTLKALSHKSVAVCLKYKQPHYSQEVIMLYL